MKKILWFAIGALCGYHYGKHCDEITKDERIRNEIDYLKKIKKSFLEKIKKFGTKIKKKYTNIKMEVEDNEKQKEKNKKRKK